MPVREKFQWKCLYNSQAYVEFYQIICAATQGNSIKIDIHRANAFWLNELWISKCWQRLYPKLEYVQVWLELHVNIIPKILWQNSKFPCKRWSKAMFRRFCLSESKESGGLMTVNIIRCSFALNKLSTHTAQRTIIVHVVSLTPPVAACANDARARITHIFRSLRSLPS